MSDIQITERAGFLLFGDGAMVRKTDIVAITPGELGQTMIVLPGGGIALPIPSRNVIAAYFGEAEPKGPKLCSAD